VIELGRQHGIYVVHDLAYADITFDDCLSKQPGSVDHASAGAREVAVEFFTMSKSYNMAGWRIGFMVGQQRPGVSTRAYEELSRLRHLYARSRLLDRCARRSAGLRRGNPPGVPAPP